MKSIKGKLLTYSMLVLMLCFIAMTPVQAKAVKQPTVTKAEFYYKNDGNKWIHVNSLVEKYNKKGYYAGYSSTYYTDSGKKQVFKQTKTYNKKGKVSEERNYYGKTLNSVSKYSYKGSKVTAKRYNQHNKLQGKEVTTGKASKRTAKSYDGKGKLQSKTVTTSKKGKPVKEVVTIYSKDGNMTITTSYSYSGACVTEKVVTKSKDYNASYEAKYKEDKAGNKIYSWCKYYDENGKLTSKSTYKYEKYASGDAKGCIKKLIEIVDGKEKSKTLYTVKKIYRVKD